MCQFYNRYKSICNNCGKVGHHYNGCKSPTTSIGIVLYRNTPLRGVEYMLICRNSTFGYSDFIKGNYGVHNMRKLNLIVDEMTVGEKQKILDAPNFSTLWAEFMAPPAPQSSPQSPATMATATATTSTATPAAPIKDDENNKLCKKFKTLKNGVLVNGESVSLGSIIANSPTAWTDPEWEFPKGRRLCGEKNLACALREFEEETGVRSQFIDVIENVESYEETFVGSNMRKYRNVFFLARLTEKSTEVDLTQYQRSEVSRVEWKTYDECMDLIRPYNIEKKQMLTNINHTVQTYLGSIRVV